MRETGRRIFIAGGGTGGHLYPGLAIAEAVRALAPEAAVAFSSTCREIDRKVLDGCGYPVTPIDAQPFDKRPWTWPGLVVSLARCGFWIRRRFAEFCPDVVIGLGGFGSYAPVRIGQKLGAATAILNPDIVPGRANRRLARRADRVFCQFQETVDALGERARLTGCPVRPSLLGIHREQGLAAFGLDEAKKTLLVTGASLGARTVNRAVVALIKGGRLPEGWQVLHLTGHGDYEEVSSAYRDPARQPAVLGAPAAPVIVRAYAEKMGLAYATADLVVARAGASTVAELLAIGLPTVFMPYPYHRDQHQMRQARAVESQGAAVVVEDRPQDAAATAAALAETVAGLVSDAARLSAMRDRARTVGRPRAAEEIAREVLDLADAVTASRHACVETGACVAGRL
jgi:UDP-N-acetylglucosamine--N-acetylmuramyl-(pentapeptide) pyrophosphoryl-undecaprenol N-acetylglucosamine transferase